MKELLRSLGRVGARLACGSFDGDICVLTPNRRSDRRRRTCQSPTRGEPSTVQFDSDRLPPARAAGSRKTDCCDALIPVVGPAADELLASPRRIAGPADTRESKGNVPDESRHRRNAVRPSRSRPADRLLCDGGDHVRFFGGGAGEKKTAKTREAISSSSGDDGCPCRCRTATS